MFTETVNYRLWSTRRECVWQTQHGGPGKATPPPPPPPQITQKNHCPSVLSQTWFFSHCAEILRLIFKSVHKGHSTKSKMKGLNFFARPRCGHTINAFSKRGLVLHTVERQAEVRLLGVCSPRLGRQGRSRDRGRGPQARTPPCHPIAPPQSCGDRTGRSHRRQTEWPTLLASAVTVLPPSQFY